MVDVRSPSRLPPRVLLAAVALVVFVASVLPLPPMEEPPPVTSVDLLGADKLVHLLSYAIVSALAVRTRESPTGTELLAVVVAVTAFGFGVEVAQWFTPGRTATLGDAIVNGVGAVVGALAWRFVVGAGGDDGSVGR